MENCSYSSTLLLSLPGEALFPITSWAFSEPGLKPSGKMAAVRKSAFVSDLGDGSLGIHETPAGVLQTHVTPDFLRSRFGVFEKYAVQLTNRRSQHSRQLFRCVGFSQLLAHYFYGLLNTPVSTLLQILERQPADFMRRPVLINHQRGQTLHATRPATMLNQNLDREVYGGSTARAGQNATVADIEFVFYWHTVGKHGHELRSVMGMDCGSFLLKQSGLCDGEAAGAKTDQLRPLQVLLFQELKSVLVNFLKLTD
jgi:hypothetical protein